MDESRSLIDFSSDLPYGVGNCPSAQHNMQHNLPQMTDVLHHHPSHSQSAQPPIPASHPPHPPPPPPLPPPPPAFPPSASASFAASTFTAVQTLPEFPSFRDFDRASSIPPDKLQTLLTMYRAHCQRIMDSVNKFSFSEVSKTISQILSKELGPNTKQT